MAKLNAAAEAQTAVADILRADPWYQEHRVRVIEQNSQELAQVVQESMSQLTGPVIIVGVDALRNQYPGIEIDLTLTATEIIQLNRERADFVTAIEAVQAAIGDIDGDLWRWQSMTHATPGGGILTATAKFRGLVERKNED